MINILLRKRILTLVWLHMYSIFIVWSRNIAVGWRWRLNISGLCGHSFKMLQNRSVKKNYLSTANNYSHPLRGDSLEHTVEEWFIQQRRQRSSLLRRGRFASILFCASYFAPGRFEEQADFNQDELKNRVKISLLFNSSWWKIASPAKNGNNFAPEEAATNFVFSSVYRNPSAMV